MDIKLNLFYYASIMLDAFIDLLCSKLCWHNRPGPKDLCGIIRQLFISNIIIVIEYIICKLIRMKHQFCCIRPLQVVVWFWSTSRINCKLQQLQVFVIVAIAHMQLCCLPFYMCRLVIKGFIFTLVSLMLLDPILGVSLID